MVDFAKAKRKRKGVATVGPEAAKPEEPKVDVKPVQADLPLVPSGPLPPSTRKLTVELDESEYQLILTYTKLFNAEHESLEGFSRIEEAQYLLLATLRWIDYQERAAAEGMEGGEAEDVTPAESLAGPVQAVSTLDPVDDDPEFVEAWVSRIGGRP